MKVLFAVLLLISCQIHAIFLNHNIPIEINSEEPVTLTIRTPNEGDFLIKCFYKYNNNQEYESIELDKLASTLYQVTIIPPKNTRNMSYYFWVYENNRFLKTFPEQDPISNPFTIVNNSLDFEYFTVLSPKVDTSNEYKKNVFVLLRNNFPKNIKFERAYFNDDEPLKLVRESDVLVSLKNTFPLRTGKNRLTIVATREDGTFLKQVQVIRQKRPKRRKSFKKYSDVKLISQLYSTGKTTKAYEDFQLSYITNYKLKNNKAQIHAYGLYDNRESSNYQPYSRYFIKVNDNKNRILMQVGDIQTSFSELTVVGRRIRGVSSEFDFLKMLNKKSNLKLKIVSGVSNKAIKISSENNTGTFKQNVFGSQLLLSGIRYKTSIQYFHIEDRNSSLSDSESGNAKPVENYLTSFFVSFKPSPLSLIQNEIAAGAYYSDSTAPTVNIEDVNIPDQLKDFIDENLPIKSSLTAGYSNKFFAQFPLNSRMHIVKLGSNWVHPSYLNALNSTIETDKFENYIGLSQKFMNKKLIVNSLFKSKTNNVMDSQVNTTSTDTFKISSVYRTDNKGSFNASILNTDRNKDSATQNMKIDNNLNYITLGYNSIPLEIGQKKFNLNILYSYSDYSDKVSTQNDTTTNSFSSSISSRFNDYDVSLGINQSTSSSSSTGDTNYLTVFNNVGKKFLKDKLRAYSRTKLLFTSNNSQSNSINSTKVIQTLGFFYKKGHSDIFKSSTINFNFDFTVMGDSKNKDDDNFNYQEALMKLVLFNTF